MANKKKSSVQKTAGSMIIGVLKRNAAFSPDTAIEIEKFKNVKLTSDVIAYTIANLMQDEIIIRTDDDRYYYSHANYRKLEKKVNRIYKMMIGVPLAVILLIFFIKDYDAIREFILGFHF